MLAVAPRKGLSEDLRALFQMSEPASKRHRGGAAAEEPPKTKKKFPTSPARAMASVRVLLL